MTRRIRRGCHDPTVRTRPALDSHTARSMSRSPSTRIVILYVLCAASVGCRYEAPPAEAKHPRLQTRTVWQRTDLTGKQVKEKVVLRPEVLSRCEAGSQLGPDGLVS